MPSFCAISSADSPEPRRNALSRWPISSKRIGIRRQRTEDGGRIVLSLRRPLSVLCRPSSVVRAQAPRRIERGYDDILITGTAAQIAGNADADVFLGRVGIVAQQF